MSIELITGIPGSGKSYLAASKMLDLYDKKSRIIYTNVNLKKPYDDYIKMLDVPDLYKFATIEFNLFKKFIILSNDYKVRHEQDLLIKEDDEIIEDDFTKYYGNYDKYLKDSNVLEHYGHSFIVWDECHNDLNSIESNKADEIWLRFFSYHRHFNIDILLITQDITLIHRKYKPFIANYYFGQNPAKRFLTKTLKFKKYTDWREFEKFYIETINVPMKKEVHDFYDSGEYKPQKSLLLKKIFPAIGLITLVGVFFYNFISDKSNDDSDIQRQIIKFDSNSSDSNNTKISYNSDSFKKINHSQSMTIYMNCNLFECTMQNSSFVVPIDDLKNLFDSLDSKILYFRKITRFYSSVAISVPDTVYNDLMRYSISTKGDLHSNGKINYNSTIPKF